MSFDTNPYSWKEGNITGTVGSISLTRPDGSIISVDNLPEEIEVRRVLQVWTARLESIIEFVFLFQILLPRLDFGKENATVLDLANFSTLMIDVPSPDVTLVLKMEPSEDNSFVLFLGYQDYPNDKNYVAKTQIPLKNSSEGECKATSVQVGCGGVVVTRVSVLELTVGTPPKSHSQIYFVVVIVVLIVNMNVVVWNQKNDTPGCWVPKTDQEMLDCTTWWWSPLWVQVSNPSTQLSRSIPLPLSVNTGMKLNLLGVKTAAGWVKYTPPKLLWCKRAVTFHRISFISYRLVLWPRHWSPSASVTT